MATYTSTQAGNSADGSTWQGGYAPSANDDVWVINHAVTYTHGQAVVSWGNIIVNNGGKLIMPHTANSTVKFSTTAALTINSGGELRTGTSSSVEQVQASYIVDFQWPLGTAQRNAFVMNDGCTINVKGYHRERYAYLAATWSSGSTFYVEGDYSSEWAASSYVYVHPNAFYSDYLTQGDVYEISSVGAYDSGNDRTPITIGGSPPTVHNIDYYGRRNKVVLVSRNVRFRDNSCGFAVGDYNTRTPYIVGDCNQAETNSLIQFDDCWFTGWKYTYDGGYNVKTNNCCFLNNYAVCSNSNRGGVHVSDFISNTYGLFYASGISIDGVLSNCNRAFNEVSYIDITGEVIACSISWYSVVLMVLNGNIVSCGTALSYTIGEINGLILGCSTGTASNNTVLTGAVSLLHCTTAVSTCAEINIIGQLAYNNTDFTIVGRNYRKRAVIEDAKIGVTDRYPICVYSNSGNVLPLESGDTDWQTPPSGSSWILQAVSNTYCDDNVWANYLELPPFSAYAPASETTLTLKIYPVGWSNSLTQDDFQMEVLYSDSVSGVSRALAVNTSQTYANGAWRECSITFTPGQAEVVYVRAYLKAYQSACYVLIDPEITVS